MRLSRGSGLAGLAAMARQSERDGLQLARPLLDIAKSQLIATLAKAKIDFAVDPTNSDPRFTRPRLRRADGGVCRGGLRFAQSGPAGGPAAAGQRGLGNSGG